MFLKSIVIVSCILLSNCTSYSGIQDGIVLNASLKKYDKVIDIIDKNYNNKSSLLLMNLENGVLYYLSGDYSKSLNYFDEAERIGEELYTISITGKLKSFFNDNLDNYYGKKYELGLIRFYKSLIYYKMYFNTGSVDYLRKSRSNIINWSSLNKSFSNNYYNDDLLQKIWGAFIYSENDDSRSYTSYKNANNTLLKYCIYPTFNTNNYSFRESYLKNKNYKDFINKTSNYKLVEDFLNKDKDNDNFSILVKRGFINSIKTKKIEVPIALSLFSDSSSDFMNFLSLLLVFNSSSSEPLIYIELPYVDKPNVNDNLFVEVYKNKEKLSEFPLIIVEPLNDLIYDDFENNKSLIYEKIISSVSVKHALAITGAYALYSNNGLVSSLAYYFSAKKIIEKTSVPDVRSWSLLPSNISFNSINLPSGSYLIKIREGKNYLYEENITIHDKLFLDINI